MLILKKYQLTQPVVQKSVIPPTLHPVDVEKQVFLLFSILILLVFAILYSDTIILVIFLELQVPSSVVVEKSNFQSLNTIQTNKQV